MKPHYSLFKELLQSCYSSSVDCFCQLRLIFTLINLVHTSATRRHCPGSLREPPLPSGCLCSMMKIQSFHLPPVLLLTEVRQHSYGNWPRHKTLNCSKWRFHYPHLYALNSEIKGQRMWSYLRGTHSPFLCYSFLHCYYQRSLLQSLTVDFLYYLNNKIYVQ